MMLGSGMITLRKATAFTASSDKKSVHRGKIRNMLLVLFSFLAGKGIHFTNLEAKQVLILNKL